MIDPETVKAWMPIPVAVIVSGIGVLGWFVTNKFNNRNEVFKQRLAERLKLRIGMYNAVLDVVMRIIKEMNGKSNNIDQEQLKLLTNSAEVLVTLYGDDHERQAYRILLNKLSTGDDHGLVYLKAEDVNPVIDLFRASLRKELGYDPQ